MIVSDCWMASALGTGIEETWENYIRGFAPGMAEIAGDVPTRPIFFGRVPGDLPEIGEGAWNMRANRLLALAVRNMPSLASLVGRYGADRVAVVLGASNTGIDEAQRCVDAWIDAGADAPPPANFDFSMIELGTPSAYLAHVLGVSGPAYTISTACSSSAKAFAAAQRLLEHGLCDAAVVGGVDGRCRFAMNGFHALGALSAGRCRPLAADRDGINLGEGVALFTLERSFSGAVGPRLRGVGESSDAYHATAPDPEGNGAEAAMRAALTAAGMPALAVDYVNLHGTGTPANDAMEMKAVERVFAPVATRTVESTKSLTGHCLGAAGAIEAALCWLRIRQGRSTATLSNSFAFGGSNASVVLSR